MRALLLRTAVELIRKGNVPTVTEVAATADVSRRTAYRYFPTQEQLLAEAALEAARPAMAAVTMPAGVEARIEALVRALQQFVFANDAALRTLVRLFLQRPLGAPARSGPRSNLPARKHRVEAIEAALLPIRTKLPRRDYERLVSALTLCVGVEAATVLRYLRGLSPAESVDACCWAAKSLVRAALRQARRWP
jgi:AcrR family transcriptional regulator